MPANDGVENSPDGKYTRLKDVIGTGSFKTVYLALQNDTATEVAWNIIPAAKGINARALRNIHSEINILAKANHPNVMKLYSWWYSKNDMTFNMITELFYPGSLKKYISKYHPVSKHAIIKWSRQLIDAVNYLHSFTPQILHRDIKCDNIFINSNTGVIKLGDMGLATIKGASQAMGDNMSVVGTPEYMSPEVFEGRYDSRADVYSVGMSMLEMATNKVPYSECRTVPHIYKKVITGEIPLAIADLLPGKYKRFVLRCISPEEVRPTSKELLRDELFEASDDEPIHMSQLADGGEKKMESNFSFFKRL